MAAYRRLWTESAGADPLDRLLDLNLKTYLLDDLLPKVDRMSMAHGISTLALAALPAVSFGQTASQAQHGGVEGTIEAQPTPQAPTPPAEEQETLPSEEEGGPQAEGAPEAQAAPKAEAAPEGALPFTGSDLVLMLLAGAGLIGLGLVLRRATGRAPAGA